MPTATDGNLNVVSGAMQSSTLSGTGGGTLTYEITVQPKDGTATLTDAATGAFTYTSYPNFSGSDSLLFTVKDSNGTSQPATEAITVTSGALGAPRAVANIGVNTDWVCYWCAAQPYVDVLHQAAAFYDPANNNTLLVEEGKLDSNGWPEEDFKVFALDSSTVADDSKDDPGTQPTLTGNYQLSFNGKATVTDAGYGSVTNQQYISATNTTTATVAAVLSNSGTFNLTLVFKNTQRTASSPMDTGVTNIQIIRPQYAPNGAEWWASPTQEFTTPFLNSFKGFSTIRYENWTKPIGSPEVNWSDRTPDNWPVAGHLTEAAPSSLTYLVPPPKTCTAYCDWYTSGQSWESVIDLANATHTDMWINIPTMATDDYIKSLAALIQSKLDPNLHVYVEWSDEIWNYGNPFWTETDYNADQTTALLANDPTAAANYKAHCASWAASECHVAERVMQFSNDFASVYGQSAINNTIRPVLCTQLVQPSYMAEALGYIAAVYGPPSNDEPGKGEARGEEPAVAPRA
ncbi:MAG: Ig-like domain-containing protein [Gammaproteobacteria bacterium]